MYKNNENNMYNDSKRFKGEPRTYASRKGEKSRIRRSTGSDGAANMSTDKNIGPPVVILDNGGYMAKIGLSTEENPITIPNCIMKVKSERKRFFIGNQIDECRDLSGLYYLLPCEKGYIMKWTVQKPVWDYLFNNFFPIEDKPVIMTQPMFNFKSIQEITDEIFFEEYEVKSLFRVNPTDLAKIEYVKNVAGPGTPCIIVDCGYSFTSVVPYIRGQKYYKAVRRINVGGKLLTNHLKDIISYRQLHVMDETYVINQVKEDTCYVSQNFKEDMRIANLHGDQNTIIKNYVLPDFNTIRRGFTQDNREISEGCQILRLNNERFTVPEILFYPSNIGMESMGIAECIVHSILSCPTKDQAALARNIVLMGGTSNFPGFKERILHEVRSYLPDHWNVSVYKPTNPETFAWKGGKTVASDPIKCPELLITKEQYEERGSSYTYEHFSDWLHSKIVNENNANKILEIEPVHGVLQSANFTRFDLFGKYEPEKEENLNIDEISIENESDNVKNLESGSQNDPAKDDTEILKKESANDNHHNDLEDTQQKLSFNKNLKTNFNDNDKLEETNEDDCTEYSTNLFENTYI